MRVVVRVLSAIAFAAVASVGLAEYPDRPVKFIVPWPPGDLEDLLTRMIAEDFEQAYGMPTTVINRPGGGGGPFPGAVEVATAAPDGYTIGSFPTAVPVLGHQLGIAALSPAQFDPLGIFLTYPFVLATRADAGFATLDGLAEHARNHDVVLGHFGEVLIPTRLSKALAVRQGFTWGGDAAFDRLDCNTLASGDADVINTTLRLILPCLERVRILVSFTADRIARLPEVPAIGEIDPALDIAVWNGLFVARDTPDEIRHKIINVARATLQSAKAQALVEETGAQIYWMGPGPSAAQIESDIATVNHIADLLQ